MHEKMPRIEPIFPLEKERALLYQKIIEDALKNYFFSDNLASGAFNPKKESRLKKVIRRLPLIGNSGFAPGGIASFYFLAGYRPNAFKFFFEMVSRWLIPGKSLDVMLIYAVDFRFPEVGSDIFTFCEVMVQVKGEEEQKLIQKNFPHIETELLIGLPSSYYARRILDIRGLTLDGKTSAIQEQIGLYREKMPGRFQEDILVDMQHFLVTAKDEFKKMRQSQHLTKVIVISHLFRHLIEMAIHRHPKKRVIFLKIFRARLENARTVLGVVVGVNFIKEKEILEKRHVVDSIERLMPGIRYIDGSYFVHKQSQEGRETLYLEVEKIDGASFGSEEIRFLQKNLSQELKSSIRQWIPPLFMPRNEEEIVRNIMTLSRELKYAKDVPQVSIHFDAQKEGELIFTVILVRVVQPGMQAIAELFLKKKSWLGYVQDRCKMLGAVRRLYAKEATVFRLKLPYKSFLRQDDSVDLWRARLEVVSELMRVIGPIRDYNGGLILKQNEQLAALKELLSSRNYSELLLENFFHALSPDICRIFLEPKTVAEWFLGFLHLLEEEMSEKEKQMWILEKDEGVFSVFFEKHPEGKELIDKAIRREEFDPTQLFSFELTCHDVRFFGYFYATKDKEEKKYFYDIQKAAALEDWETKK